MDYKAIYDTVSMKGVEYDFTADEDAAAIDFCQWKFSVKDIVLLNCNTGDITHLGDNTKTHEIARSFFQKKGLPY